MIVFLDVFHALADGDNMPDALVAGNERRIGLHRPVTVSGMQIGMQTPEAATLTRISPFWGRGVSTSSIAKRSPNLRTTAAFIVLSIILLLLCSSGEPLSGSGHRPGNEVVAHPLLGKERRPANPDGARIRRSPAGWCHS